MTQKKIFPHALLILTALILLSSAACSNATGPVSQTDLPNYGILFASDRQGDQQFYIMQPDGSQVNALSLGQLPANTRINSVPSWSKTQQKFFFSVASLPNEEEIYSVNANGSNLTRLTNTSGFGEATPVISPNGKYLAYLGISTAADIFVIQPDGNSPKNLTQQSLRWYFDLAWTPDSSRLLFSSPASGSPNIFSIRPDGTDLTNITKGMGNDGNFSISPDGKLLAFDSDRAGYNDIFTINIDGSGEPVNLTNSPEIRDRVPLWSPDGKNIAFYRENEEKSEMDIFVISLADHSIINLTNTPTERETSYIWSPDGAKLLFVAYVGEQQDIFSVGLDGSAPVNLTNNPANDYGPLSWLQFK